MNPKPTPIGLIVALCLLIFVLVVIIARRQGPTDSPSKPEPAPQPKEMDQQVPLLEEILKDEKSTVLSGEERQLYKQGDPSLRALIGILAYTRIYHQLALQDPMASEAMRAEAAELVKRYEEEIQRLRQ